MLEAFISDIHYGEEDKPAVKLMRRVLRHAAPDLVFLGGDILDVDAVSRFPKSPDRNLTLQAEFDYGHKQLGVLRQEHRHATFEYLLGNHEYRLEKYLMTDAKKMHSLRDLTIRRQLKLDDLSIQYHPYRSKIRRGHLWHVHGDNIGGSSMNVARTVFRKLMVPVIFGHYHTFTSCYATPLGGSTIGAFSNGTLHRLDPEYVVHPDWQQGVTLVDYSKSGYFHVQPVVFFRKGERIYATVGGKEMSIAVPSEGGGGDEASKR